MENKSPQTYTENTSNTFNMFSYDADGAIVTIGKYGIV
jgi:glucose dehydrogenase